MSSVKPAAAFPTPPISTDQVLPSIQVKEETVYMSARVPKSLKKEAAMYQVVNDITEQDMIIAAVRAYLKKD